MRAGFLVLSLLVTGLGAQRSDLRKKRDTSEKLIDNDIASPNDNEITSENAVESMKDLADEFYSVAKSGLNESAWRFIDSAALGSRAWRLPNITHPLIYHLHLTTNIHRGVLAYSANCTIELLVDESTAELVLHSRGLAITHITIIDLTTQRSIDDIIFTQVADLLIVKCDKTSANCMPFEREHVLRLMILYTNHIIGENVGFHTFSYEDKQRNQTIIGAITQLEPMFARTVLPCYDEPRFKAVFAVSITHGSNYTAISNMLEKEKIVDSEKNMTTTVFKETPLMSAYLLAFVISDYVNQTDESDGLIQRAFKPPNSPKDGMPALQEAKRALKMFGDFIDVPYALPKLDHFPVPESYGNAMENWGLITYLESVFLYGDELDVGRRFKQSYTQNHELVHMWFGNLVSPEWWTHIWLSEGFATYFSYLLTDMMSPELRALEAFQTSICSLGYMLTDSKPMSAYVEQHTDIMSKFNAVTYCKAPCIIQMFHHAFGQETFRKAVSNYMKKHAYSVANEDDLYDVLQTALTEHFAAKDRTWQYSVSEIMKTWTHTRGYPLVTIHRNYAEGTVTIKQRPMSENSTELWWIPLSFVTASRSERNNTEADLFMPPIAEFTVDLHTLNISLQNEDWLLANNLGMSFYAVQYDDENMRRVIAALRQNHNSIHRFNRATLVRDLTRIEWDTANVIERLLELIQYLSNEDDPMVWIEAEDLFRQMNFAIDAIRVRPLWENFMRNTLSPILSAISKKPVASMSLMETYIVETLLPYRFSYNFPDAIIDAKNEVLSFVSGVNTSVSLDLMLICPAAKGFDDLQFERAMEFLMQHNKHWELLYCTRSDAQYEKLLRAAFNIQQGDDHCEEKLRFLADLVSDRASFHRAKTWELLESELPNTLQTTACSTEIFYEQLAENAALVRKENRDQYLKIVDISVQQQLKAGIDPAQVIHVNRGVIGTDESNIVLKINEEELISWLEKANELYENNSNIKNSV